MSDLYWLTDEQMTKLAPFFPKSHGKPRVDDKRKRDGVPLLPLVICLGHSARA